MPDKSFPELYELEQLRGELEIAEADTRDQLTRPYVFTDDRASAVLPLRSHWNSYSEDAGRNPPHNRTAAVVSAAADVDHLRPSRGSHFIIKLWHMVNDPSTDAVICWAKSGTWFGIRDRTSFSEKVLPLYFKHNNMNSFVRQLNMYGFRKVVHTRARYETASPPIEWAAGPYHRPREGTVYAFEEGFAHPYFVRGCESHIDMISRRSTQRPAGQCCDSVNNVSPCATAAEPPRIGIQSENGRLEELYQSYQLLKLQQEVQREELNSLRRGKLALIAVVRDLMDKYTKQQQMIQKLVTFLVNLLSPSDLVSWQRTLTPPLMIGCGEESSDCEKPGKRARTEEEAGGQDEHLDEPIVPTGRQVAGMTTAFLKDAERCLLVDDDWDS